MDAQLTSKAIFALKLFVVGGTILLLFHTRNFSIGLCLAAVSYALLDLARDYVLKLDLSGRTGTGFLLFQLLFALTISIWSESFVAQLYLLILIGEFTFYHSRLHSIVFTCFTYISILIGVMIYRELPPLEDIYILIPRVIDYFAMFGMSLFARLAFEQKNQLAIDNERLRIASVELEHKTALQERARISREIHDSVGHTLTAALSGVQTASRAIRKDNHALAAEMMERTEESIRRGLNDVRTSVHLLREGVPGTSFLPEIVKLIEETKGRAGVQIDREIDESLPELPPLVELTIYRALQEGLTNGLRHAGSTRFRFKLNARDGAIRFRLENEGPVPGSVTPGFGLNSMKERVEAVSGKLTIGATEARDGMSLNIDIPWPANNPMQEERE
ncbi:sensor histidine kinase [Cohnella fermenti]|nr:sensor histidine kinase [Cohnella fermenti]